MRHKQMQWFAIAFPAALIGLFEYFRHPWLEQWMPGIQGNLLGALLVAVCVYGFVHYFTARVVQVERELGHSRAEAAVLAERQRIAREMHDGVAQALFHLRVRLQEAQRQAEAGALIQVQEELFDLQDEIGSTYEQVRAVISDLKHQAEVENKEEALRRVIERAALALGLEARLQILALPSLDLQAFQHAQAIALEAMTNARRHGGATNVWLTATADRLVILDNGIGFDPRSPQSAGFGLMIMAERAEMAGGRLEVEAERGKGTRVSLEWEAEKHDDSTVNR